MDLKQLEYFVRVAELGSFTRASITLNVAQPALSRRVRQLEVELRQSLLIRNGRGVVLTDAGARLLEHGRGILHQVERAIDDITDLRESFAGHVAVGMPPSVARALTVPLIRLARLRLPDATISITESLSTAIQEALQEGRIDVALLYNPTSSPNLHTETVLEEELFLVSAASTECGPLTSPVLTPHELAKIPLVIPTKPNAIRMQVESELAATGHKPTIAYEVDGVPAILALVADGAGSAVLSRNAVSTAQEPERFVLRPIEAPTLRSLLAVATSAQRPSTRTQRSMLALVQMAVQEHMACIHPTASTISSL